MNDNKRIAVNSIVILVRLIVVSLIGIYTSRKVLEALGVSDFGLYNVVGGIVVILNVLNTAMTSSTYRYIAYEIGRGKEGNPNAVFNVSLQIHAGFSLAILLIGYTVGYWYIMNYLNVAAAKLPDAVFVFRLSILTAVVNTLFVPYQGMLVAFEKFAGNAVIETISVVVKLGGILWLVDGSTDSLRVYAMVMFGVTAFTSLLYCGYGMKVSLSTTRLRIIKNWALTKEMLSFALWTSYGAAANIGKMQGCALLINWFFGTMVNAAYAIGMQVDTYVMMFARSLNNAAIPQITKNFGGGNVGRSVTLTAYISKYTFLLMLVVAFPAMIEMDFLLDIWLANVPQGSATFCRLMLLGGLLLCLGEGISAMVSATGSIRTYQLVVNTGLLLGLPVTWICYKLGCSCFAVSVVYCVVNGVTGIAKLYVLSRVVKFDIRMFWDISYQKVLYVSIPLVAIYLLYNNAGFGVWGHLAGLAGAEVAVIVSILLFGTDSKERKLVMDIIKRRV